LILERLQCLIIILHELILYSPSIKILTFIIGNILKFCQYVFTIIALYKTILRSFFKEKGCNVSILRYTINRSTVYKYTYLRTLKDVSGAGRFQVFINTAVCTLSVDVQLGFVIEDNVLVAPVLV